jgi:hypothetical protein
MSFCLQLTKMGFIDQLWVQLDKQRQIIQEYD